MSGVITLLPLYALYALVTWTGISSPLHSDFCLGMNLNTFPAFRKVLQCFFTKCDDTRARVCVAELGLCDSRS